MSALPNIPFPRTLDASQLASHLSEGFRRLEEIQMSREELRTLLTSEAFREELELRTMLALANIQLIAARFAGAAMATTIGLLDADKPEVARRAACTVLQTAGIATTTKAEASTKTTTKRQAMEPLEALAKTLSYLPFTPEQTKAFREKPILAGLKPEHFLTPQQRELYEAFLLGLPRPATKSPYPNDNPIPINKDKPTTKQDPPIVN